MPLVAAAALPHTPQLLVRPPTEDRALVLRVHGALGEVKRRCDVGHLLQQIAKDLRCDRNTVTQALRYWHSSHEQETPDGRARRRTLLVKTSKPLPSKPATPEEIGPR